MNWLIYGGHGWIGKQIVKFLKVDETNVINTPTTRVDDSVQVRQDFDQYRPDRVICCIGRTHGPGYTTIDYLEQEGKLVENVRDNLFGPLFLANLCRERNLHLTYMGTGCIFTYDEDHQLNETSVADEMVGFTESDSPNYFDSSYSVVKGFTDRLMQQYSDAVLNVRIRMPITHRDEPRNFISKITRYAKICSVPNSMTVLDELLPIMLQMAAERVTGAINLTNPGVISHNEILEMYQTKVDPTFTWENFSVEEQRKILSAGRSNNLLDTTKLQAFAPQVKSIHQAIAKTLDDWQK